MYPFLSSSQRHLGVRRLRQTSYATLSSPHSGCSREIRRMNSMCLRDPWPTRLALRLPAPEPLVASPVPREDGLGLHDHEGVLPARPVAPKPDPEESISPLELGAGHLPSVDAELLTKRGYLQQKVSSGSGCRAEGQDENPKGSKHGERAAIRERDRQRSWRGWGFRGPRGSNKKCNGHCE